MEFIERIKSIFTLIFVLIYLVYTFLSLEIFKDFMTLLIVFLVIINIPNIKGSSKYISFSLFLIGIAIMLIHGANVLQWQEGLNKNAGIIALIVTVPMMSFPLYYDDFQEAIINISGKYLNTSQSFYRVTSILSYSLGILLYLAGITLIFNLLKEANSKYSKILFSTALTRGFMGSSLWSPNFVGMAVVLHYLNLSWLKIAPWGFLLSIITLVFSIKYMDFLYGNNKEVNDLPQSDVHLTRDDKKSVLKLAILTFALIMIIVVSETYTGLSVLVIVPVLAFLIPPVIALLWGKQEIYISSLKDYLLKLPQMKNEFILFTAAGFFGESLNIAGVGNYISGFVHYVDIQEPFFLILIFFAAIILPSLLGIHPVIGVSTLAITLPVTQIPLQEVQYALTLLAAYGISLILSPTSGTVLVTSGLFKENPLHIGFLWNWKYSLVLCALYVGILSFVPN